MPNATFSIVDQDPADEDITGPKGSSKKHSMKTDLSCVGFLWALLSFAAMGLTCVGFYMPLWLQGSMRNGTPTSLGLFRRCNYLRMNPDNKIELIMECGRYTTFHDIPSLWWQIATVMVAVGAGLLVVVAFGAMLSCCVLYVVSRTTSKFGGSVQFLAGEKGLLKCVGMHRINHVETFRLHFIEPSEFILWH